eukprot:COSAG01_NODE_2475_length_7623_cov_8.394072_4_plen_169_part_00
MDDPPTRKTISVRPYCALSSTTMVRTVQPYRTVQLCTQGKLTYNFAIIAPSRWACPGPIITARLAIAKSSACTISAAGACDLGRATCAWYSCPDGAHHVWAPQTSQTGRAGRRGAPRRSRQEVCILVLRRYTCSASSVSVSVLQNAVNLSQSRVLINIVKFIGWNMSP